MTGYSQWTTAVVELMGGYNLIDATSATPTDDSDLNAIIPSAIASAEGMMYRDPDLDFLATRAPDATQTTTSNVRLVPIPTKFLTIEQAVIVTPVNTQPNNGTRISMSRVSPEVINAVYPQQSFTAPPQYGETMYAMFTASNIMIGPTPDGSYVVEYYGVVQQTPLSATNTDTILTNYFGDAFLAASMIYMSGYMKDFASNGGNPDNASQGVNWKTYYDSLKSGVAWISARQRYLAAGASAYPAAPTAMGQR